ncbi:hypothetical protein BDN72DRAFT_538187 [Pluteus cervinus]|uniref:Uncharacterized protein n=1 Tax=Pluteus cervinus TaxID=181527 RepID=A0ACD3AYQ2_9AGAR|nr:hypothetical protein BDN72DRAFT_538187 [Pluteus cervinus]
MMGPLSATRVSQLQAIPSEHPTDQFFSSRPSVPPVQSHYRPFSTLHSAPVPCPPLPNPKSHPKSVVRRRSVALSALSTMGFSLKDIVKDRESTRTSLKPADIHIIRPGSPMFNPSVPYSDTDYPLSSSPARLTMQKSLKKKRSLASLLATDNSRSATPVSEPLRTPLPPIPSPSDAMDLSASVQEDEEDDEEYDSRRYVRKNKWVQRHGMQLHPYAMDAPYMQAYNPIMLENDRYTGLLLNRLNPNGTPSFHDYGRNPPPNVLDLGCGQGHWVKEAASAWRQSRIIGFDLVDVTLPSLDQMENVTFVRGNFLKYQLPFPDNHFDLVRMANLTLCIPYDKWEFVLEEVRRVLVVGGRLELIDDQICFPYGETPSPPSSPASPLTPVGSSPVIDDDADFLDIDDDDETLEDDDNFDDSTSTVYEDTYASFTSHKVRFSPSLTTSDDTSLTSSPPSMSTLSSFDDPDTPTSTTTALTSSTLRPSSSWGQQANSSKDLETIFEDMLNRKYGVHPRPSEFLLDLMKTLFGRPTTHKLHSFHLKLAPVESSSSSDSDSDRSLRSSESYLSGGVRKPWKPNNDRQVGPGRRYGGDPIHPPSPLPYIPDKMSAKAADRLGISYSALAAASSPIRTNSSSSSSLNSTGSSGSKQSPGMILWPSTFIAFEPTELEMHACKNLHLLLGCKAALAEHIASFTSSDGKRIASDDEFEDTVWRYECFRRRRFHWPSQVPESNLIEESARLRPPRRGTDSPGLSRQNTISEHGHSYSHSPATPTFGGSKLSASSSPYVSSMPVIQEEMTHVRTLRVFEAIKHTY